MPLIDAVLADILVCPQCHGPLTQNEASRRLDCPVCLLGYPVREDGIPVMLIDSAIDLGTESTNDD